MYMQGEEPGNEALTLHGDHDTISHIHNYTEHIQDSSIIHLTVHILHSNLKK